MENPNVTVVAVGLLAMILGGAFASSPPQPTQVEQLTATSRRDRSFTGMSDDAVMLQMAADMGVNPLDLQHACHYWKPDGTVKTGFAGFAIQGVKLCRLGDGVA